MNDEIEVHGRAHFAEVAEVLETPTEYVFAVIEEDGGLFCFWTPDWASGDETIWSVWLKPDADGILQLDSVKRPHPGMWERIKKEIEEGGKP